MLAERSMDPTTRWLAMTFTSLTQAPSFTCDASQVGPRLANSMPVGHLESWMTCPMCGHERRPDDAAPTWQCPACKVAYVKAAAAAVKFQAEPAIVRGKPAAPEPPVPPSEAASRRERAQREGE